MVNFDIAYLYYDHEFHAFGSRARDDEQARRQVRLMRNRSGRRALARRRRAVVGFRNGRYLRLLTFP